MNTFYVPALAGMIYTMPGMETQLHAVINKAGVYDGISGNYSGPGFSGMRFKFHGLSDGDFEAWVAANKAGGNTLTRADYLLLEQPSEREPVRRFASVEPGLWGAIVDRCVDSRKMCASQMMAIDAAGGAGRGGLASTMRSAWRDVDGNERERRVVAALCTPTNLQGLPVEVSALAAPTN
jgi:cytochrome o ubiquinol oxidase subunit 2